MTRLIVLGATGQVGQALVRAALADAGVQELVLVLRRPWAQAPRDARVRLVEVDYEALPTQAPWWRADAVLCALGTTRRQAGSAQAFARVDHDHVLAAAQAARQAGTPTMVLVSSIGANPRARSLYLRVKGQTEMDLAGQAWPSLTVVRPSLLVSGPRPDWRPAEALAQRLSKWLNPLVPLQYRSVTTAQVAQAMLHAARQARQGYHVLESRTLHERA